MTQLDQSDIVPGEPGSPRKRLSMVARLGIIVGVLALVALAIVLVAVFGTGITATANVIDDTVWVLEVSEMTVEGETTRLTTYPDTVGSVFASNGAHLAAENADGWSYTSSGSWKITDDQFTINGAPVDARWKWNTLIIEYPEGQLLKHLEYKKGDVFDIRGLVPGVWQGPADMWLDWYKFEGDTITLAEDGSFELGDLTGTWAVDEVGSVSVTIDTFEDPILGLFQAEDSSTLSLQDPQTRHSLALLDRIE